MVYGPNDCQNTETVNSTLHLRTILPIGLWQVGVVYDGFQVLMVGIHVVKTPFDEITWHPVPAAWQTTAQWDVWQWDTVTTWVNSHDITT